MKKIKVQASLLIFLAAPTCTVQPYLALLWVKKKSHYDQGNSWNISWSRRGSYFQYQNLSNLLKINLPEVDCTPSRWRFKVKHHSEGQRIHGWPLVFPVRYSVEFCLHKTSARTEFVYNLWKKSTLFASTMSLKMFLQIFEFQYIKRWSLIHAASCKEICVMQYVKAEFRGIPQWKH